MTKSASRGAHSPVRGHPRGSKVVPLNRASAYGTPLDGATVKVVITTVNKT